MNKEELAALLNGRCISLVITPKEAKEAENDGLVIVYGASDDLLEFEGAINEEIGAYGGVDCYITKKGKVKSKYKEGRHELNATRVNQQDKCFWRIVTTIPHTIFSIWEDGELFCDGIVFSMCDL